MPIYEYQAKDPSKTCEHCKSSFQVLQSVSEHPLTVCPECGAEIVKLISTPGKPRENILSSKNLAEKGFSQYTRKGKGYYEKTAGQGPATLHDPGK